MTVVLGQDNRAYLAVERSVRYALGDPAAPTLLLNDVDDAGCMWWAEPPDGWDAAEMTTPVDRKGYGDGGYAGEPSLEPRTLTLSGTVTAPSPEELSAAYRRFLSAVQGRRGSIRYTHLDELPTAMGLWCKPVGKPKWAALDTRVADFSFLLVAEDPIKTGAASSYGPVRLPPRSAEGGYPLPAAAPWTAGGGTTGSYMARVANDGDEDSQALYTVTGPVPQPVIRLGNGAYVGLSVDLAALDVWTVDTAAGVSRLNGVNRPDAFTAGSTLPLVPAGGVEVRLRSLAGGTDPAAGLTILTAPSWK